MFTEQPNDVIGELPILRKQVTRSGKELAGGFEIAFEKALLAFFEQMANCRFFLLNVGFQGAQAAGFRKPGQSLLTRFLGFGERALVEQRLYPCHCVLLVRAGRRFALQSVKIRLHDASQVNAPRKSSDPRGRLTNGYWIIMT